MTWSASDLQRACATVRAARALNNPYWLAAQACGVTRERRNWWLRPPLLPSAFAARRVLVAQYAWAIPDPHALAFVACALGARAVEMGAGTGYWASLLTQLGVDILAYDEAPPDRVGNIFHSPLLANGYSTGETRPTYTRVEVGAPDTLRVLSPDRALFLCWPPYHDPMAFEALTAFGGQRVVYIGEEEGGCTSGDAFFAVLARDWWEVAVCRIAQWDGIHDRIYVYDRV